MNYALLAANGLAFLYEVSLGDQLDPFIRAHGFVPARAGRLMAEGLTGDGLLALVTVVVTSMFLHGGWLHVVGNLLYLRVFGDNIEDRIGHAGYLVFYLLTGAAAAFGQYLVDPDATVPMIGASGAIAGVLGAYIVMFPSARVVTLFPIFIFLTFIEVPAVVFLGIWAAQQLLYGYLSVTQESAGQGVAWFAHIGGFAFGAVAGVLYQLTLGRRRRRRRRA